MVGRRQRKAAPTNESIDAFDRQSWCFKLILRALHYNEEADCEPYTELSQNMPDSNHTIGPGECSFLG